MQWPFRPKIQKSTTFSRYFAPYSTPKRKTLPEGNVKLARLVFFGEMRFNGFGGSFPRFTVLPEFMRTTNDQGVSYSTVSMGAVRFLFLSAVPAEQTLCHGDDTQGHGLEVADYPAQIRSLIKETFSVLTAEGFTDGVLMLNVFLADIGKRELFRQLLVESHPGKFHVATYIPQSPADGSVVALELFAVAGNKRSDVLFETILPGRAQIVQWSDVRWFFGGNFLPSELPIGAFARSLSVFQKMGDLLKTGGFSVDQLVRTWIFQGHLVLPEGDSQRYKELNRARTDFFYGKDFLKPYLPPEYTGAVYPASTGIGADDVDVVMSCCAISTKRKDVVAVPLENPQQTSAFDYGAVYSPQSPKFARAAAVAFDDSCLIFVSGTASITNSESRFIEDPEGQTNLTLDNIAALIDGKNLERHGIRGFACGLNNLESVRVYVKRPTEFERIRNVCRERLGDIPILYTIADVCRPELLVEIEGIAVSTK